MVGWTDGKDDAAQLLAGSRFETEKLKEGAENQIPLALPMLCSRVLSTMTL